MDVVDQHLIPCQLRRKRFVVSVERQRANDSIDDNPRISVIPLSTTRILAKRDKFSCRGSVSSRAMKLYRVLVGLLKNTKYRKFVTNKKPFAGITNTSAGSLSGHRYEKVIRCVKQGWKNLGF